MRQRLSKEETGKINEFLKENDVFGYINNLLSQQGLPCYVGEMKFLKKGGAVENENLVCPDGYTKRRVCGPGGRCHHICVKID